MKILYLFNGYRGEQDRQILRGENHDDHFHGMYRLRKMGFETDFDEIEKHAPRWLAVRLRRIFGTYAIQLITFWRIFWADVVFSPTAFALLYFKSGVLHAKYPRWAILDFGLIGMIGEGKTLKQKLLQRAVAGADGIVTLSPAENDALRKMFPEKGDKIRFIYHNVDTEYFRPRPDFPEDDVIFSPGRDAGRDFLTLFKAMGGLPTKLVITAREEVIAKYKPFPPNVTRASYSHLELRDAYARAKVLVITLSLARHNNDAMGLSTLMEMMATGKPVVATDTETMRAYIKHGENGLLVPEGDPEALRKAIQSLLSDEALRKRLGAAARAFTVKYCAGQVWTDNIAAYFKELAA